MVNAIRMMLAQGRLAAPAVTQGEGDVAFAWDGATWDVGELDNGFIPVTLTLTLGGVPITDDVMCIVYVNKTLGANQYGEFTSDIYFGEAGVDVGDGMVALIYKGEPITHSVDISEASTDINYYLRVMLPTGALVSSDPLVSGSPA